MPSDDNERRAPGPKVCSVEGCSRPHLARGLCQNHYTRTRLGTVADRFSRSKRAARLRTSAAERRSRWLQSLIGTTSNALIENNAKGHSDGFAPLRIEGSVRGEIGMTRITGREGDRLTAEWA